MAVSGLFGFYRPLLQVSPSSIAFSNCPMILSWFMAKRLASSSNPCFPINADNVWGIVLDFAVQTTSTVKTTWIMCFGIFLRRKMFLFFGRGQGGRRLAVKKASGKRGHNADMDEVLVEVALDLLRHC